MQIKSKKSSPLETVNKKLKTKSQKFRLNIKNNCIIWCELYIFSFGFIALSPPPFNSLPPGEGELFLHSLSLDGRGIG
jgi:hypothetical protein